MFQKKFKENVISFRINPDEREELNELMNILGTKTRSEAIRLAIKKVIAGADQDEL